MSEESFSSRIDLNELTMDDAAQIENTLLRGIVECVISEGKPHPEYSHKFADNL